MKTDYCVFVGRFQPFTNAHKAMVDRALEEAENVIIVVGSDNASISLRNPFTTKERIWMMSIVYQNQSHRITYLPIPDSAYNFTAWIAEVQRRIGEIIPENATVKLIGHFKDGSSYYLKYFPQWELVSEPSHENGLSATKIRDQLFNHFQPSGWQSWVPSEVIEFIEGWKKKNSDQLKNLIEEQKFIKEYKEKWEAAPFPPTFVTTDAVVFSHGHILLIKRGRNPGKGKYALPGGFLDQEETIEQGCIRELREETKIDVAAPILKSSIKQVHVFDAPWRDPRGRTITHAHHIELTLKDVPKVKAADDAAQVEWVPVGKLEDMEGMFFNDHLQIIKFFLGRSM